MSHSENAKDRQGLMSYLTSSRGMRWHYEEEGHGPALLFLHGWGVDGRIWRQQHKYFSRKYRVISLDLPGHGQTEWQPVSLPDIARDILELFIQKDGGRWGVVASSFGGLVALSLAEQEAAGIKALAFVGALPKFVQSEDFLCGLTLARVLKLKGQIQTAYPSIVRVFFRSLFTQTEREGRRYKWIQTFRRQETAPQREALISFLDIIATADLRPVLSQCPIPVQMINGTEDYICPRPLLQNIKKENPQVRLDWLGECGHFPFLTKPYEFNDTLERFLTAYIAVDGITA